MPEKKYKLCYPQLGNYDIPIQYFVNNGLHLEYLAPPAMTKRARCKIQPGLCLCTIQMYDGLLY